MKPTDPNGSTTSDWLTTSTSTPFGNATPGTTMPAPAANGGVKFPLIGDTTGAAPNVTSASTSPISVTSLASKAVIFNPPVHTLTKAPKADWVSSEYFSDSSGQGGYNGSTFDKNMMNWGRLGAIYTWDYNNSLNITDEEKNSPEYKAAADQFNTWNNRWGAMFHYNPTSLSYSVQSNENIPAYNTVGDSMNLIVPGAASVSIDLYFNRIYDLANSADLTGLNAKKSYGTWLSNEDVNGIKTRGTEYDIEFIYRACNGDPGDALHVDYKTADYGFFMRTPIVLHLGPFRYLGFLTGVSVNHILFNTSMVPTFSQVSLQFARMITMGHLNTTTGENPLTGAIEASNMVGSNSTLNTQPSGA